MKKRAKQSTFIRVTGAQQRHLTMPTAEKCLPSKAGLAQTLNAFLLDKMSAGVETKFTVPSYIQDAINHLVP